MPSIMKIFENFWKKSNSLNSLLFVYMNSHYMGWIALTEEMKEYLIKINVKCLDCGYNLDTLGLKLIHKGHLDRREINIVKFTNDISGK